MEKKVNALECATMSGTVGFVLLILFLLIASPSSEPNPIVVETQQAFDRVMAGEEVPLQDIRLILNSSPQPFIHTWCRERGLEGEAAQQKRDELFRAYQNLKVRLGEPVAEAENPPAEK